MRTKCVQYKSLLPHLRSALRSVIFRRFTANVLPLQRKKHFTMKHNFATIITSALLLVAMPTMAEHLPCETKGVQHQFTIKKKKDFVSEWSNANEVKRNTFLQINILITR